VGREDLAGVEGDDGYVVFVGDGQDPPAGVGRADLEVVEPAAPAQGDRARAVGDVVAEPEVGPAAGARRQRLRRRPVRLARRPAPDRPVGPLLVVLGPERVELDLQLGERPRCRLPSQPALEGLVEALDPCPWVWGCPGAPFFWRMPR
jgi:hypothetical protein